MMSDCNSNVENMSMFLLDTFRRHLDCDIDVDDHKVHCRVMENNRYARKRKDLPPIRPVVSSSCCFLLLCSSLSTYLSIYLMPTTFCSTTLYLESSRREKFDNLLHCFSLSLYFFSPLVILPTTMRHVDNDDVSGCWQ